MKKPTVFPPPFETPNIAKAEEPPPPEPPTFAIVAKNSEDDALAQRLTDYVHHRLNQHLPSAVAFYVAELREVIAGKRA